MDDNRLDDWKLENKTNFWYKLLKWKAQGHRYLLINLRFLLEREPHEKDHNFIPIA